jgi:putative flippase GtrA
MLFSIVGLTMAGIAMITVLMAGYTTPTHILIAASIGAVIGIPATWFFARIIYEA